MHALLQCPECKRFARMPEHLATQWVRCPACKQLFTPSRPSSPAGLPTAEVMEDRPQSHLRASLTFTAQVTRDSEGAFDGWVQCRVTREGLEIARGLVREIIPIGATAQHLGGSELSLRAGIRQIDLTIPARRLHAELLARDLAAFLNRERKSLDADDYRRSRSPLLVILPLMLLAVVVLGGLIFVATRLIAVNQDVASWPEFTPANQAFAVRMPGTPVPRSYHVRAPDAVLQVMEHRVEQRGATFMIATVSFPEFIRGRHGEGGLLQFRDFFLSEDGGRVTRQQGVQIDGHPGIEFVFELPRRGGATGIARFYFIGTRGYLIQATGPGMTGDEPHVRDFLDSFRLLEQVPPLAQVGPVQKLPAERLLPPVPVEPPINRSPEGRVFPLDSAKSALPNIPLPRALKPRSFGWGTSDLPRSQDPMNTGLKALSLRTRQQKILPCLSWSADGNSCFIADQEGLVSRVEFGSFIEQMQLQTDRRIGWMSLSAEGLLLTLPDLQEVWLLDHASLAVRKRIPIAGVKRAVSATGSALAYATTGEQTLTVLDLKAGAAVRQYQASDYVGISLGLDLPQVTPDGKHVFTRGASRLHRFRVADTALVFEESSAPIINGPPGEIQLSGDGRFVCLPAAHGNSKRPEPNHPSLNCPVHVFRVADLQRPAFILEAGSDARCVGFDDKEGLLITHNAQNQLLLFKNGGQRQKQYRILPDNCEVKQLLVHPLGRKFFVVTQTGMFLVDLGPAAWASEHPRPVPESTLPTREPWPEPIRVRERADLRGRTVTLTDCRLTPLTGLPGSWSNELCATSDGKYLFWMCGGGKLKKINADTLQQEGLLLFRDTASWLSMSKLGLVVTLPEVQEVWVIHPGTLQIVRRIRTPRIDSAVSSAGLEVAYGRWTHGGPLVVIDLQAGCTVGSYHAADLLGSSYSASAILQFKPTPDGKFLLGVCRNALHRFSIDGSILRHEQSGPALMSQSPAGIAISHTGEHVCLPSFEGNYPGLPGHPHLDPHGAYVYPVANLEKPAFTLAVGRLRGGVHFGAELGILAGHEAAGLNLFAADGKLQRTLDLPLDASRYRDLLVLPGGKRVIYAEREALYRLDLDLRDSPFQHGVLEAATKLDLGNARFRQFAFDLPRKSVLSIDGGWRSTLWLFSYPDFEALSTKSDLVGYVDEMVYDPRRALLYTNGAMSQKMQVLPHRLIQYTKRVGGGDIAIYDVRPILERQKMPQGPSAIVRVGESAADLQLAPDGQRLFCLDPIAKPPRVVMVNLQTRTVEKDVSVAPATRALTMAPDGKHLYALAPSAPRDDAGPTSAAELQVIDAVNMKHLHTLTLDTEPYDLVATSKGLVFLSTVSDTRNEIVLVDALARKEIVARWADTFAGLLLRLSADEQRLYAVTQVQAPALLRAFAVPEVPVAAKPALLWQLRPEDGRPLEGPLSLSPDGKFVLGRLNVVHRLPSGAETGQKPTK